MIMRGLRKATKLPAADKAAEKNAALKGQLGGMVKEKGTRGVLNRSQVHGYKKADSIKAQHEFRIDINGRRITP